MYFKADFWTEVSTLNSYHLNDLHLDFGLSECDVTHGGQQAPATFIQGS